MTAFENVMGYDSLKQELTEIIDLMKHPEIYEGLGVSCPNGLLLYGDPGLGKTLIANEFIEASGRDAIVCRKNAAAEGFIDSIRESFDEAARRTPSILLLDDMDKFANDDEDHCDSEAYVTIQSCIDAVKGSGIFVIATANNVRKLPRSLTRTGRFDRKIEVEQPNEEDSELIISHYLKNKGLSDDVDTVALASLFRGSSCSTLETVINQAGMLAGYRRAPEITMDDLVKSYLMVAHDIPKDQIDAKGVVDVHTDDGDADVYWHEAAHAAMNEILVPGSVSVALAVSTADADRGFVESNYRGASLSRLDRLKANILVSLASAAAMDITFGRVDPGTKSDIHSALNSIDKIQSGLGGFAGLSGATSSCSSYELDHVREIATSSIAELFYQKAKQLLCKNRRFLEAIACALAENAVITATDIAHIREEHTICR